MDLLEQETRVATGHCKDEFRPLSFELIRLSKGFSLAPLLFPVNDTQVMTRYPHLSLCSLAFPVLFQYFVNLLKALTKYVQMCRLDLAYNFISSNIYKLT